MNRSFRDLRLTFIDNPLLYSVIIPSVRTGSNTIFIETKMKTLLYQGSEFFYEQIVSFLSYKDFKTLQQLNLLRTSGQSILPSAFQSLPCKESKDHLVSKLLGAFESITYDGYSFGPFSPFGVCGPMVKSMLRAVK